MQLHQLVSDLEGLGPAMQGCRVVLATRRSEDCLLPESQAKLIEIGELVVDAAGHDVDFRPGCSGSRLTVTDILSFCSSAPHALGFTLNGIEAEVQLPDGRVVRSSAPILGTLALDAEVLLLLHPKEQWPTIQFGA